MPVNVLEESPMSLPHFDISSDFSTSTSDGALLEAALFTVQSHVAPMWPLKDFVAVNPFVGFTEIKFLEAMHRLQRVRDGEMLMPISYYRRRLAAGELSDGDIMLALEQCSKEYPEIFSHYSSDEWQKRLVSNHYDFDVESSERPFQTLAEWIDRKRGSTWASIITNEVSRHCAAHYDEGQAIWQNPWQQLPLFSAWRETAMIDRRFEKLGVSSFREFVSALPDNPREAIAAMLTKLSVQQVHWQDFLECQLFSMNGWASYIKYRVKSAEMTESSADDLIGLIAIRLAYDVGLHSSGLSRDLVIQWPSNPQNIKAGSRVGVSKVQSVAVRYAFQVAAEVAYRRRLSCNLLAPSIATSSLTVQNKVQMVFCIDVRSELIRRHLEAVSGSVETFGFAGFFGLPMEYVPLGALEGSAQCPVLLSPSFCVHESVRTNDPKLSSEVAASKRTGQIRESVWKLFQSSAISCFSFVESTGVLYLADLIKNAWGLRGKSPSESAKYLPMEHRSLLGPVLQASGDHGVAPSRQIELAEGILRNLGLTDNFARLVAFCGHGSETVNNPYRAGLDCGACGGHSGESNARYAALLLNDGAVRSGLRGRGIHIPESTWFIPAVHNTTTDEIEFFDIHSVPSSHHEELKDLKEWVAMAGQLTRSERASRLGTQVSDDTFSRSRDWSEVRPEWGLAGNAAFLVAPRSRTKGKQLDGRTFMHSYDFKRDSDLKVLELIMTAPMVVANWINLQYYASTVDNHAYGSGNKVLHNVVGLFGIQQGNGGDLMTGLPWQSVHDGHKFQHEPLRLSVVIEAPRFAIQQIIDKHQIVQELAGNGWLTLLALEEEQLYVFSSVDGWSTFQSTNHQSNN